MNGNRKSIPFRAQLFVLDDHIWMPFTSIILAVMQNTEGKIGQENCPCEFVVGYVWVSMIGPMHKMPLHWAKMQLHWLNRK